MDSITTVRSEKQEGELANNRLANLLFVSWAETALVARFHILWNKPACAKQHHLSRQHWWQKPTPSALGWTGGIRIDTKLLSTEMSAILGVWTDVPRNRKKSATMTSTLLHISESLHFVTCPTLGRVTRERLHFLVQDHRNPFDSASQCACKVALHGVTSHCGSDIPLVVPLGNILNLNKETHLSQIFKRLDGPSHT